MTTETYPTRAVFHTTAMESVLNDEARTKVLDKFEEMHTDGSCVIHDNQKDAGDYVFRKFTENRSILNVMVIARTQSGKTGIACAIVKKFTESRESFVPIENIYIITGLSSTEWLEQTKARFPSELRSRIFHRPNLTHKFAEDIRGKKNTLVILDEVQVAALKHQTLDITFKKAGFSSIEDMLANDTKLVEITATPDGTCYDLNKWVGHSTKIRVEPGPGYTSAYDLFTQGRVRQGEKLELYITEEHNPFISIQKDMAKFTTFKYHIFRVSTYQDNFTLMTRNLMQSFGVVDYRYVLFDQNSKQKDINSILKVAPDKHTFILIKEKLRCAKSIVKTHLGILYERIIELGFGEKTTYKCNSNSVIIQSLIGRCTGYDDTGEFIVYTDIQSIYRYEKLWNSGFDETSTVWKSSSTANRSGGISSKETFLALKSASDATI